MEFDTIKKKLEENKNNDDKNTNKIDMIASIDLSASEENAKENQDPALNLFGEKIHDVTIKKVNRRERTKPSTFTMYPSTKLKLVEMASNDGISASELLDVLINAEDERRNS